MVCDFLKYGTYCTAFQRIQICGALRYIVYSKYVATLRWLAYASYAHHRNSGLSTYPHFCGAMQHLT